MIVFKDAEKHEPKKAGEYLCIVKCSGDLFYENIFWKKSNSTWGIKEGFDIKVLAFSETPPEQALKGISEDPEETVCKK